MTTTKCKHQLTHPHSLPGLPHAGYLKIFYKYIPHLQTAAQILSKFTNSKNIYNMYKNKKNIQKLTVTRLSL
jgi:hypothetical protein